MRREYNAAFRNMILELHFVHGKSIRSLADEYDVSVSTINRWIIHYKNKEQLKTGALSKGVPFDN